VALAVSLLGLVLYLAWVLEPSTTWYGLPGGDTWHAVADDLSQAWERFGRVVAPVPTERGFLVAASIAIWIGAVIADWAAFRLGTAFEAMVPSFAVFVFAAALGADRSRAAYTALYLAAALAFLLIHGAARRAESTAWFASRLRGGPRAIVQGGVAVGVVAVLAALVLGPVLPGAGAAPLIDWRNRDRNNDSRVTVSPLVDIRSRLLEQSNVEVFTVRSPVRSYWRLTSLDTFDGQVWGSKGSYRRAEGGLPGGAGGDVRSDTGVQQYQIESLESPWLPAAFRPDGFQGPGDVSYDPDSASLLTDQSTGAGLVYRVRSSLPLLTRGDLERVPLRYPSSIADEYLVLPGGFPASVRRAAQQVTARQRTPYQKAIALQDWFRNTFTYDTSVQSGHGDTAIEQFLNVRRGYCEQFAGTYAAMMRSLGIPARVAVGFTPGRRDAAGTYHVTGRQAHAWPEVWFDRIGWVAFEPTPGRGAPGAEAYTGVPEQQDTSTGPAGSTGTTTPGATTTVPGGSSATTAPGNRPGEDLLSGDPFTSRPKPSPWGDRLQAVGVALLALLVAWVVGVPSAHALRRRRRMSHAASPDARTLAAWDSALEALALAGVPRRPSETNAEYARRASTTSAVGWVSLDTQLFDLACDATAAAFGATSVDEEVADRAALASAGVVATIRDRAGWVRRVRWALDPRPLLPRRSPDAPSVWRRVTDRLPRRRHPATR
jgi:transglutaminase-like putative cysteine protease